MGAKTSTDEADFQLWGEGRVKRRKRDGATTPAPEGPQGIVISPCCRQVELQGWPVAAGAAKGTEGLSRGPTGNIGTSICPEAGEK